MGGLRNLWGDFKTPLTTDPLQNNQTFARSMEKMCSHDVEVLKLYNKKNIGKKEN